MKFHGKHLPTQFHQIHRRAGGWRAVRGEGPKPVSNFVDHAGPLTEMVLAGNLAVRPGKKIDWDAEAMEARGLPEVKAMLKRVCRAGWEPKLG